ncbi:MAG: hypothetical protein EBR23_10850 [Planctomycetia bacterium]|nr:hypothetical protein [Planctomycetia bacterium]
MFAPEAGPALPKPHRIPAVVAVLLACLTAAALPGCSAQPSGSAGTEPAKGVVVAFLEAIKKGDENTARGMLTRLARTKTEEIGISVAPPVRDTATYSVHACEMVSDTNDLVHVGTTWTDVDTDGFKTSENVVWVVRLDPEGWRVVGMAMRVFDDMAPLLLNFEDPEDMLAKQEMVAAELEKRAKQEATPKPAGQRTARGEQAPAQLQ